MAKALFTEKQRFRQKWIIIMFLLTFIIAVWGIVQQIILGIPFGNNPAPNHLLFIFLLIPLLIFIIFFSLTLHTRVDNNGITYRFAPIHRKERLIKWSSIKEIYVRKYKPIAEYGGWGFRRGRGGIAFNTSGNMGLQLVLINGKKILIGTQKSDELDFVLKKLGKRK